MLGKAATWRLASIVLATGVVLAAPLAGAFSMGVDAASVAEMKNAGATPAYGQVWAGHWMEKYGWGGFESELRKVRDAGVTPVVMWYFWGDDISPDCVKSGCAGRTKGEWDAMAKEMAKRANAVMGSRKFYVVVEPEFQKNGIQNWETFDGYLADQVKLIRAAAPNADFVAGFGHWGNWDLFDRYVAQTEMVGFQVLRGSTRDSADKASASANYMIQLAKSLKSRWGKPVMVFDLGISTYGGWDGVQEKALQGVLAKRGELDAAGVKVIIWRYVYDNDHSSGYFGPAEKYWGVKRSDGAKKPAYDELVKLINGGSGSAPSPSPSPQPSPPPSTDVFSKVSGNEWWIQAKVAGSPTKVTASVDGKSPVALQKKSWGDWAVSTHAPKGSTVELRATFPDGSTASARYAWPPGSGTTPAPAPSPGGFSAKFSGVKVLEWWVQTDVDANEKLAKVEARVNGGSWVALDAKSYGWAKSVHVSSGGKVEFRATSTSGATATSQTYSR